MIAYKYVTNAEDLGQIANEIDTASVVAADTETTALSPYDGKIRLISLNTGKGVYVVDAFKCGTLDPIVAALRTTNAVLTIHNAKFDQRFLFHHYGLELNKIFDTFRASSLIYNGKFKGRGGHDLYALYQRELGLGPEAPELGGSDWAAPELTKEQLDYAAEDVTHLPTLREVLRPKLATNGLNQVALIEFQAILPEAVMELNGIPFDKHQWVELAHENERLAKQLEKELLRELPHPQKQLSLIGFDPDFNLGSPQQVLKSLQMLGLKADDDRGGKKLIEDTNEMTLAMCTDEFPIVEKLLKFREYRQAVKTFGENWLEHLNPHTGRVHTNYWPFTGAGRYACLPKSSRVATNRGLIPIGDVAVGDLIQTPFGPRPITKFWDKGRAPLLRFKLSRGRELVCTAEHQVLVDGEWRRAGDVDTGMYLYASGIAGPDTGIEPTAVEIERRGWKRLEFPTVIDETLALLLGHYVAEGCIGFNIQKPRKTAKRKVRYPDGTRIPASVIIAYSQSERDLADRLMLAWQKIFGPSLGGKHILCGATKSPAFRFSSGDLGRWLLAIGAGGLAHEKRIPPKILEARRQVKGAFIRGLFEGDGGAYRGRPSLTTYSPDLAEEVATLLASEGIHFTVHKGKGRGKHWNDRANGTGYIIRILGRSREAFRAFAGFVSPVKQARIGEDRGVQTGIARPTWFDGGRVYTDLKAYHNWTRPTKEQRKAWQVAYSVEFFTPEALTFLLQSQGVGREWDFLRWAAATNATSLEVLAVEAAGEAEVCDISVEDAECFMVDGVVVHNSSDPNLQNLPRDKRFRRCFCTAENRRLVLCDYGQIELRIASQIARDQMLMQVYIDGRDAHTATAALVTGKDPEDVTKGDRQIAKSVNFGLIYGMSAKKLRRYAKMSFGVSMSLLQAEKFRDKYFGAYEGIRNWHQRVFSDEHKAKGISRTLAGRLRYLDPKLHSEHANTPVQGTGADGLKKALRCVYDRLKKYNGRAKMIHMVHDEIMLETDNDPELVAASKKELQEGMIEAIQPYLPDVPVEAEPADGPSWAEK